MSGTTRQILDAYGLAPSKKRGQNFLVHERTARAIVQKASFAADDHIVEVGVGLGALTVCLANDVKQVTGFEIDRGIIRYHHEQQTLPSNVELIHADILKTDFAALREHVGRPLKIISNLPYSISNPFIFALIDNRTCVERVVILLQKEVADRLQAGPGTKEYGVPTIMLQSCATVTALMHIDPAEFHPRPKVESSLIRVDFNKPAIADETFAWLRATVRAAFSSRRKTVINNLLSSLSLPQEQYRDKAAKKQCLINVLETSSIRPEVRAERIEIKQFQKLAEALSTLA